jgi:TDG/mug DNA glycosylase family protein
LPSNCENKAIVGATVADVIAPKLHVLFCGINPGLYSAAVGHHFARPGNRFWPTLFASEFTPRLFSPSEELRLLKLKLGITNVVARTTAKAAELTPGELRQGARELERRVQDYQPRVLAILGITAYRTAFGIKDVALGEQNYHLGKTRIWILPNPSGLNAHFQLADLARLFKELRLASTVRG